MKIKIYRSLSAAVDPEGLELPDEVSQDIGRKLYKAILEGSVFGGSIRALYFHNNEVAVKIHGQDTKPHLLADFDVKAEEIENLFTEKSYQLNRLINIVEQIANTPAKDRTEFSVDRENPDDIPESLAIRSRDALVISWKIGILNELIRPLDETEVLQERHSPKSMPGLNSFGVFACHSAVLPNYSTPNMHNKQPLPIDQSNESEKNCQEVLEIERPRSAPN